MQRALGLGQHQQRFGFASDDKKPADTEAKKEEAKEEPKKGTEEKKTANKKQEDSTSSSDEEGAAGETLSKEDIQKIKKLIGEQDKEIETLKEQVK